jgi:REP element-mobilizing transposase RayT
MRKGDANPFWVRVSSFVGWVASATLSHYTSPMPPIRKSDPSSNEYFHGKHRFEHWYRDNQVYFITARCRDRFAAFATNDAKAIFWNRFTQYTREYEFTPWVTSLLDNHYHTLGYLRLGENLGTMMQKLHGSVAKLVNDQLEIRLKPFWRDRKSDSYMDGCIRNEVQCRRAYRYTLTQAVRHGLVKDWRSYTHTQVDIDLERGVKWALELKAFLEGIPYQRYQKRQGR